MSQKGGLLTLAGRVLDLGRKCAREIRVGAIRSLTSALVGARGFIKAGISFDAIPVLARRFLRRLFCFVAVVLPSVGAVPPEKLTFFLPPWVVSTTATLPRRPLFFFFFFFFFFLRSSSIERVEIGN